MLKRVLEWNGYRVRHVMNVTDVGHLTSDADEGEDKMEKGARRTGKSAWEIAELYTEAFLDDMKALNIEDPTMLVARRPTTSPSRSPSFADIEKNGYTYRTSDGVYFDTAKQPDYGYLARLDVKGLEAGKRGRPGREAPPDRLRAVEVLARRRKAADGMGQPVGQGFPGLAHRVLGDGAEVPRRLSSTSTAAARTTSPSITRTRSRRPRRASARGSPTSGCTATSCCSNDAKMAKSAGDVPARRRSLIERGYDPLAYRYLCLTGHYRGQLNFTWDALDAAAVALDRMRNGVYALRGAGDAAPDPALLERFTNEINDDLNMPRALAVAWETLRGDRAPPVKRATLLAFDRVFGLGLASWAPKIEVVPDDVRALADARAAARGAKDWAEADRLRGLLAAAGWEMEDRADGYALKRRVPAGKTE